jgi:predicted nucleic acid-binding protein
MIRRIYIDTSVVGGYFEPEFEGATIPFFEMFQNKKFKLIASEILEAELLRAPQKVRDFWDALPQEQIDYVELTEDAINLADRYIGEHVVGRTSRADCQHIALATLNHADVLVSWNFKHIVNLERIRGYNSINIREGYPVIEIRTPREIINYGS